MCTHLLSYAERALLILLPPASEDAGCRKCGWLGYHTYLTVDGRLALEALDLDTATEGGRGCVFDVDDVGR